MPALFPRASGNATSLRTTAHEREVYLARIPRFKRWADPPFPSLSEGYVLTCPLAGGSQHGQGKLKHRKNLMNALDLLPLSSWYRTVCDI